MDGGWGMPTSAPHRNTQRPRGVELRSLGHQAGPPTLGARRAADLHVLGSVRHHPGTDAGTDAPGAGRRRTPDGEPAGGRLRGLLPAGRARLRGAAGRSRGGLSHPNEAGARRALRLLPLGPGVPGAVAPGRRPGAGGEPVIPPAARAARDRGDHAARAGQPVAAASGAGGGGRPGGPGAGAGAGSHPGSRRGPGDLGAHRTGSATAKRRWCRTAGYGRCRNPRRATCFWIWRAIPSTAPTRSMGSTISSASSSRDKPMRRGDPIFHAFWSIADGTVTPAAERQAFEDCIDLIMDRWTAYRHARLPLRALRNHGDEAAGRALRHA